MVQCPPDNIVETIFFEKTNGEISQQPQIAVTIVGDSLVGRLRESHAIYCAGNKRNDDKNEIFGGCNPANVIATVRRTISDDIGIVHNHWWI